MPVITDFEPEQQSTPTSDVSANQGNTEGNLQAQNQSEATTPTHNVKREPDVSGKLDEDSDIICLGEKEDEVITIEDDLSTQEMFLQCNNIENSTLDNDNTFAENLITVQTQPTSPIPTVKKNLTFNLALSPT